MGDNGRARKLKLSAWTDLATGANHITVTFINGLSLSDTRMVLAGIRGSSLDSNPDGVADWLRVTKGVCLSGLLGLLQALATGSGRRPAWSLRRLINAGPLSRRA